MRASSPMVLKIVARRIKDRVIAAESVDNPATGHLVVIKGPFAGFWANSNSQEPQGRRKQHLGKLR